MAMQALQLEPLLTFPREAEIGKSYLFTVDLRAAGPVGAWPYQQTEEVTIYFFIDAGDCFKVEPLSEPAVVLHRFGGTYGPARFLLRAGSKESEGLIRVTYVNGAGMPLGVIESPTISVRARAQVTAKASTVVRRRSSRRSAGQSASGVKSSVGVVAPESLINESNVTREQAPSGRIKIDELSRELQRGSDTSVLMQQILATSPNEEARREAVLAIGESNVESADIVRLLQLALSDASAMVRAAAAQSISKIERPKAYELLPALIGLIKDESADVRISAASALGVIGDITAVYAMEPLFHDLTPEVRFAAAAATRAILEVRKDASARPRVFLNYSPQDQESVDPIYYRLLTERFDPWMDRFNIPPRENARREFEREKRNARIMVLFLSAASGTNFQREIDATIHRWERAPRGSFHFILVRLDQSRIQNRLTRFEPVDLFSPDGWRLLSSRIERAARTIDGIATEDFVEPDEEEIVPGNVADDPWKGQFGGQSERNYRKLTASVTKRDDEYYQIGLTVSSTDPSRHPLGGEVKFYLPPQFAKNRPTVKVGKGGRATVRRLSLRPFTAGALVDRGATRLELDLSELADAPSGFGRERGFFREQAPSDSVFKYACFLSYSAREASISNFVGSFQQALTDELELLTGAPVRLFLDQESVGEWERHERVVAAALAQSACYIIFFTPGFFSDSMQRRELEAMRLQQERRQRLSKRTVLGMILPIVLQSRERMPTFLQTIQGLDLSKPTSSWLNWSRSRFSQQQIRTVAEFVFRNCKEAESVPEAFAEWESFVLPPDSDLLANELSGEPLLSKTAFSAEEASALLEQAQRETREGQYQAALPKMQRALEIYRALGNAKGQALALNDQGELYYITGNNEFAERHYKQASEVAQNAQDLSSIAIIQDNLGLLYASLLRREEAEAAYRQSLNLFQQLDDKPGMAAVLGNLGLLLLNRNDIDGAIEHFERQLALAIESQQIKRQGIALSNLGVAYARRSELKRAIDFHRQAILVFERFGDLGNGARALDSLSRELADDGQTAEAITIGERAAAAYDRVGDKTSVDQMNELLVRYRRDLPTQLDESANEEAASEAKIKELASDYERIRRELPSGDERTWRMEEIVAGMRRFVPAVYSRLATFAESESPGLRLAAVVILQNVPDQEYLDWLAKRLSIEKPFIGYHAALALLSAVRELDMGFYAEIRDAIATARISLDARGLKDADRTRTLDMANRELHQSWISRYFTPAAGIRTIGRRLRSGIYSELASQLKSGEVVIALFLNPESALAATYVPNEARRKQIQRETGERTEGYFAVSLVDANKGMQPPISASEDDSFQA